MKNKVVLFLTGYMMLIFSSCLNSDDADYEITIRDPQIASFALSHDSIPELSSVKFVIDQVSNPGLIYNRDSLPYGTDKIIEENEYKLAANIGFTTGVSYIELVSQATGDTVLWTNGGEKDSINFSQPVDIKTIAYDGFTTKRYLAKLNVHQVLPDTMIWRLYGELPQGALDMKAVVFPYNDEIHNFIYSFDGNYDVGIATLPSSGTISYKHKETVNLPPVNLSQLINFRDTLVVPTENGELYFSEDGFEWKDAGLNYFIVSVLGEIKPENNDKNNSVLSVIIEDNGDLYSAALTKDFLFVTHENGEIVKEAIQQGFPVEGFGIINYNANYFAYLLLVAGKNVDGELLNATWMSTDGVKWSKLTTKDYFEPKSGVMTTWYDGKIYMFGGLVEGSKQTNDIYFSQDRGISWALADSTVVLPNEYKARGYGSIYVDDDNFMFIFGGKGQETENVMNEIWRGRINRLGFEIQ